jgi:lipopolysaccharide export system ATP-binding protein
MLKANNLRKKYGKREVVRGVSLQVEPGKVVGLLGPNGAGKTTCFYMIVGLISSDDGTILVDDVDITHEPVNIRSTLGVGYLPQDASIFRKLSVSDNILAILEMRPDLDKEERESQLVALMDDLGIAHLSDQMGVSLSGGERRRAASFCWTSLLRGSTPSRSLRSRGLSST